MGRKVLFVDDEPNVLQSIRRSLCKNFDIETAESGQQGLDMLAANGSYAVIVSDMRMPKMSGVEFLAEAKRRAPDSIRMMLTGNADQQTAVDAVNVGDIFRFMNKPCDGEELSDALTRGIRQYELITAEKELLEQTLHGSINALADVLALSNPEVFGSTSRSKSRVSKIVEKLGLEDGWVYESAAMLCKLGCVGVPEDLVRRRFCGAELGDDEFLAFADHVNVGARIVTAIPRMEGVARAIQYQQKGFDGSGYPQDSVKGTDIPLGGRILKVVLDYDFFENSGAGMEGALQRLRSNAAKYDPEILAALAQCLKADDNLAVSTISIMKLDDSMSMAEDLYTSDGALLIAKGQQVTLSVRRHLQNYRQRGLIEGEVVVRHAGAAG